MKKTIYCWVWAAFYIICFILGLIPSPTKVQGIAMTVVSVLFFIPGALLLYDALQEKDKKTLRILQRISILSLALTTVAIIANIMSVYASRTVGDLMNFLLNLVSVPMFCSRHYVLSLFLWACIMICTLPQRKKA